MNNINKIGLSLRAMDHILSELINRKPHSMIKFIFEKDKEMLIFFAKTILYHIEKINKNDINIKNGIDDLLWIRG